MWWDFKFDLILLVTGYILFTLKQRLKIFISEGKLIISFNLSEILSGINQSDEVRAEISEVKSEMQEIRKLLTASSDQEALPSASTEDKNKTN